jgi:hypothetical protein
MAAQHHGEQVIDLPIPSGQQIAQARASAGLTQSEAAALVHLSDGKRWSEYERGTQPIEPARWELFVIKTGGHPKYRVNARVSVPRADKQARGATGLPFWPNT